MRGLRFIVFSYYLEIKVYIESKKINNGTADISCVFI